MQKKTEMKKLSKEEMKQIKGGSRTNVKLVEARVFEAKYVDSLEQKHVALRASYRG
jgi:bacteriocin-like protein